MGNNPTGFKVTDAAAGWSCTDVEDIFVRKDCFLEGGLWLWGFNGNGEIGDNGTVQKSSPVQTFSGGTNWKSVNLGRYHSSAIKTDGTLWLWGYGGNGQLGRNNITSFLGPVETVSGGTDWKSSSLGRNHSVAIKTDGTLWVWGAGANGRLGTNNVIDRSSPVQTVSGGTNWKIISTGLYNNSAIKTDGTLWVWGFNGPEGRLGTNDAIARSSPVQTVSGGTNWRSVSNAAAHTAAIKTDGTLWLWGLGGNGRLGTNDIISRSSPVQTVSGGTNWRSVALSLSHTAAIKTDGTLWTWGLGSFGRLGTNDIIDRSSPVQTISGGTNWRSLSTSTEGAHTTAIKTDGTLWLWGININGHLGTNNAIDRSSPVQTVSGGTNWRTVSTGTDHTGGIREDCW